MRASDDRRPLRNHTLIGVWTDDRPQDSERPGPEVLVEAQPEAAEAQQQEREEERAERGHKIRGSSGKQRARRHQQEEQTKKLQVVKKRCF